MHRMLFINLFHLFYFQVVVLTDTSELFKQIYQDKAAYESGTIVKMIKRESKMSFGNYESISLAFEVLRS